MVFRPIRVVAIASKVFLRSVILYYDAQLLS
jgi:hypothetical protein